MRTRSQSWFGVICTLMALLGTLSGVLAIPIVASSFADSLIPQKVTGGQTELQLNVEPVLGLWLSSDDFEESELLNTDITTDGTSEPTETGVLIFSAMPSSGNTYVEKTVDARVMTNNLTGYTLYVEMAGSETALKHTDNSVLTQIAPTTAGSSLSSCSWGVKGGSQTTWIPVPASGSGSTSGVLVNSTSPTTSSSNTQGSNTTTITFGVKTDYSLISGIYTGTVVFTAVTNGITE